MGADVTQASSSLDDLSRGPEPQPANVWRDAGLAWLDGGRRQRWGRLVT